MIIAHHDAQDVFKNILKQATSKLEQDAKQRNDYYLQQSGVKFEKDVYQFMETAAKGTVFEDKIELVSGYRFPDIVAYINELQGYGLEVKTTTANKWTSTGSSIFEGTRVSGIDKVFLLFGKLSHPIGFKCRKYEDCLYQVAVTHSPRYLIDMDIPAHESIFAKIGISYDDLRTLDNPFQPIKAYFRKRLNPGEDLWWMDDENDTHDLAVKLWSSLEPQKKEELRIAALAYFPSLVSCNQQKYGPLATWLVAKHGVVNHALRDTFTAGGRVHFSGCQFPKIFKYVIENLDDILKVVSNMSKDDALYYWDIENIDINLHETWKSLCIKHGKDGLNLKQRHVLEAYLQRT